MSGQKPFGRKKNCISCRIRENSVTEIGFRKKKKKEYVRTTPAGRYRTVSFPDLCEAMNECRTSLKPRTGVGRKCEISRPLYRDEKKKKKTTKAFKKIRTRKMPKRRKRKGNLDPVNGPHAIPHLPWIHKFSSCEYICISTGSGLLLITPFPGFSGDIHRMQCFAISRALSGPLSINGIKSDQRDWEYIRE